MVEEIKKDASWELERHWSASTVFPLVSFPHYASDLAGLIGALPPYLDLLFTRPRLALQLLIGQFTVSRFHLRHADPKLRLLVEDNLPPPPAVPMAMDVHMGFLMILLALLGFDSLRLPSFARPTATQRLVAWAGLPLWLLLLTPSFYYLVGTAIFRVLHPMNLLRCYKIYVQGVPDGQMEFASAASRLVSKEFSPVLAATRYWTELWILTMKPVLMYTGFLVRVAWSPVPVSKGR